MNFETINTVNSNSEAPSNGHFTILLCSDSLRSTDSVSRVSQLSTELCVVKRRGGREVSKKADLKRVPGGFELSSMLDKHKFTLGDSAESS